MKKDAQPRALLHQNQIINFYVEPNGVSAKKINSGLKLKYRGAFDSRVAENQATRVGDNPCIPEMAQKCECS